MRSLSFFFVSCLLLITAFTFAACAPPNFENLGGLDGTKALKDLSDDEKKTVNTILENEVDQATRDSGCMLAGIFAGMLTAMTPGSDASKAVELCNNAVKKCKEDSSKIEADLPVCSVDLRTWADCSKEQREKSKPLFDALSDWTCENLVEKSKDTDSAGAKALKNYQTDMTPSEKCAAMQKTCAEEKAKAGE